MIGRGGRVVARTTTDESGAFTTSVPPGRYQVVAHDPSGDPAKPKAGDRYAHPARNPILLPPGGDAWVGLQMVTVRPERRQPSPGLSSARVSGVALYQGAPVEGAIASLFPDVPDAVDRGLGITSAPPSGPDGRFSFGYLDPGSYRLSVRKRRSGEREGPAQEGDLEGYYPLNPVKARGGEELNVEVELTIKKRPFFIDNLIDCPTIGIAGVVRDGKGAPVEGVYVFAYRNREIGKGKPDSLSAMTGPDGRYQLPLPSGGRYYFGARERFGSTPGEGEWYGLYTGSAMHDLVVPEKGIVQGIEIVVERIIGARGQ
jgi:hypothetical protein